MDLDKKHWREQQKLLAASLKKRDEHDRALELFLIQHARVHAAELGGPGVVSFDAQVWEGLPDDNARMVPPGEEHSIAWLAWHMARCEDITFNLLVACRSQVIDDGGWVDRMRATVYDTGNVMDIEAITSFSAVVDLDELRAYRTAVGQRTREIVRVLPPGDFLRKVDSKNLVHIRDTGSVVKDASYLIDYWGKQKVSGLMLMPATRHLSLHLNEAMRIKTILLRRRSTPK